MLPPPHPVSEKLRNFTNLKASLSLYTSNLKFLDGFDNSVFQINPSLILLNFEFIGCYR